MENLDAAKEAAKSYGDEGYKAFVKDLAEDMKVAAPVVQQQVQMVAVDAGAPAAAQSVAKEVEFVPPDSTLVKQYMFGLVATMTGAADDEIDGDTPLMESGIDSLASVELRTKLQAEFRLNLPSTVMFNYPTISTLTDLLVEECTQKKISWG